MGLYLVRHGQAEAGVEHLDPGLDSLGREQAEHAARALGKTSARRLIVSPLRRTRETANPISRELGLEPEIREEVSEVFEPSMSPDRRRSMLAQFLGGCWSAQSESLLAWRSRVTEALLELGARDEPVVVVSHFVAISVAIGAATGDDRVSPCPLANASITTLEVTQGRLVLRHAGDVSHLPRACISGATVTLGRPPSSPAQ